MDETLLQVYSVKAEHERLSAPFECDLIATSEASAINRVRGTIVHYYRCVELLYATFTVTDVRDYTPDWRSVDA